MRKRVICICFPSVAVSASIDRQHSPNSIQYPVLAQYKTHDAMSVFMSTDGDNSDSGEEHSFMSDLAGGVEGGATHTTQDPSEPLTPQHPPLHALQFVRKKCSRVSSHDDFCSLFCISTKFAGHVSIFLCPSTRWYLSRSQN